MSLLTINNDLLWWYSVCYAEEGLDNSLVYWTFGIGLPVQSDGKTLFLQGGSGRLRSRALTLVGVSAVAHPTPPSAPNVCERPVKMLVRSDVVMNWNFNHAAAAENQHVPAQTVWPAGGCTSSQTTCLYYIVLTKSPCLTPHPSIAMEKPCWCTYLTSVQMHLFEKENETLTYL